jgi:orotidine-5'-phosphate decarboxylase
MSIIEKFSKRAKAIDSLLCVGLDADVEKLPTRFKEMEFPQFEFNKYIIEETYQYAVAYKSNSAFYEASGDQGMRELKMTMDYLIASHPDIFTILDAKRADIGNTNSGYVTSIFDWLGFDAVTLHPYLGKEALAPFLERKDKVSIILCRTSNSGAGELQDIEFKGKKIWEIVGQKVSKEWNANNNCMIVVGATYPEEMRELRKITGDMTFLVPGIGAQGGNVGDIIPGGLNREKQGLIINSARGIIFAENPKEEARKLCEEIRSLI